MQAPPSTFSSIRRGFRQRCPNCGAGRLFFGYLKPVAACDLCGADFGHIRADDFPPYLTILLVGHLIVPAVLISERWGLSTAMQTAIWLPVTLALSLLLLPCFKGAVIGLMWSLGMGVPEAR